MFEERPGQASRHRPGSAERGGPPSPPGWSTRDAVAQAEQGQDGGPPPELCEQADEVLKDSGFDWEKNRRPLGRRGGVSEKARQSLVDASNPRRLFLQEPVRLDGSSSRCS